jgi:hypothetical protein
MQCVELGAQQAVTIERWPALPYDAWKDTYATLHMWTQIVGKIALAHAAPLNHSWGVALQVGARGLRTAVLRHGDRTFEISFDLIDHELVIETADGARHTLALAPRSVADFYAEVMAVLNEMQLPVRIWSMPVEIPTPIPFENDTTHHAYEPQLANRFFRVLLQVHRVFEQCRCEFVGKCSPVHFFWGSFDLAVTRFSGRPAPARDGPAFMRDAYSHEVVSHGFWPGSEPLLEPAFYAYAVPEPTGLKSARVEPDAAFYHSTLNEFVLPYEAVRTARSPDDAIRAFVSSTYDAAATLANWDVGSGTQSQVPLPAVRPV